MKLEKIITGGQTGVDRAALDVALELAIACGGWCPHGRRAEDGPIPARYPLTETPSHLYPPRTAMNVRHSDGTLILTRGQPDHGTTLTRHLAQRYRKALLLVPLEEGNVSVEEVCRWIRDKDLRVVNIAGPRESSAPGIQEQAHRFLLEVFKTFK